MVEVENGGLGPKLLIFGGVVVHYVGTSVALAVLGGADEGRPGRRAIAQWLPIFATAMAAVAMHHPEMAVALVFGSCIACLSLLIGLATYVGPLREFSPSRRLWPLVLPPALLALLAGFHGTLTWFHAVLLGAVGVAFMPMWIDHAPPRTTAVPTPQNAPPSGSTSVLLGVLLAILLAAAGAWLSSRGAIATANSSRLVTALLMGSTILAPLLLLPALGVSSTLAQHGRGGEAITSLVGTVLLNLCLLLPLIVLANYLATRGASPTPFPLVVWRLDSVVLLALGFALVPVAAGRWLPERMESVLLVLIYGAYLVFETLEAARRI